MATSIPEPDETPSRGLCPQCGHGHAPGDRFCARCGASLPRPDPETTVGEGELTILHAELRGRPDLATSLLPRDLAELLDDFQGAARGIVEGRHGLVNQRLGASLVAVFGLAEPPTEAACAAVEAALELRSLARRLEGSRRGKRPGLSLTVHGGVESGLLATRPGDGVEGILVLTGEAIQTAGRLRARAGDDETWLGPRVDALAAEAFETEATEPLPGPDGRPSGRAQRVLRRRSTSRRPDGGTRPRLVGRDWERATMVEACLEAVSSNEPRTVLVEGGAGLGKTQLLETFLGEAPITVGASTPVRGVTVWAARAEPPPVGESAYAVVRQLLQRGAASRDPEALDRALDLWLGGAGDPDLLRTLRWLARTPGTERAADPAAYPLEPGFPRPDRTGRRGAEVRAAFAALVAAVARPDRPLILAVDDWHWADEASRRTLAAALAACRSLPLVVVLTSRPESGTTPDGLPPADEDFFPPVDVRMALEPLAAPALAELLGAPAGEAREASPTASSRSAGGEAPVPWGRDGTLGRAARRSTTWAVELSRWVRDRAAREGDPNLAGVLARQILPANVEGLVRSRFEELDDEACRLLETAAVLSDRFSIEMLGPLLGESERTEALIDRLGEEGWLRPDAAPGHFAFDHRVAWQVAYDQIDPAHRLDLHGRVLGRWRERGAEPSLLAHHAEESGRPEDAALAAAHAGDAALDAGENELARRWHGRSLARYEALPETPERRARWVRTALQWVAGQPTADERHQIAILRDAHGQALSLGLEGAAAEALHLEGVLELGRGHVDQALSCLERCLRQVGWDDPNARARLYRTLGRAWTAAGEIGRGQAFLEDAIALRRALSPPSGDPDPEATRLAAEVDLAANLADRGFGREARLALDAAEAEIRDARRVFLEAEALAARVTLAIGLGQPDQAARAADRLAELARGLGDRRLVQRGQLLQAVAAAHLGSPGAADALRAALDGAPAAGPPLRSPAWDASFLAEAAALAGLERQAVSLANRALRGANRRDRLGEVPAHRALALALAGALPDRESDPGRLATDDLRIAIELAQARGARLEAGWSALRLAELTGEAGAAAAAQRELAKMGVAVRGSSEDVLRAQSGVQPTVPDADGAPPPGEWAGDRPSSGVSTSPNPSGPKAG